MSHTPNLARLRRFVVDLAELLAQAPDEPGYSTRGPACCAN
jgi:hypothetical protein